MRLQEGYDRLRTEAQATDACPEKLIDTVRTYGNGHGLQDDATAILIRAQFENGQRLDRRLRPSTELTSPRPNSHEGT